MIPGACLLGLGLMGMDSCWSFEVGTAAEKACENGATVLTSIGLISFLTTLAAWLEP